jgi:nitrogen fixation protein NifU and related proteins
VSDELYHAELVARAHAGRGRERLANPDRSVTLDNPLCGDRVTLELSFAGERIGVIGHRVRGCLLCEASAETIARHAPGKTRAEIAEASAAITALLKEGAEAPTGEWESLDAFRPVRDVKSRQDCVLLPFEALAKALA